MLLGVLPCILQCALLVRVRGLLWTGLLPSTKMQLHVQSVARGARRGIVEVTWAKRGELRRSCRAKCARGT